MNVTFENNVFVHVYLSKYVLSKAIKRIELALFSVKRVKEGMAFETRCSVSEFCDLEQRAHH